MNAEKQQQADLQIPFSADDERAILGHLMLNFEWVAICQRMGLVAEDFFLDSYRIIYRVMLANQASHPEQFDPISLMRYLKAQGDLERVGGGAAIGMLWDGVVRFSMETVFEGHIRAVQEFARRRLLMRQANQTLNDVADGAKDSGELVREVQRLAEHIQANGSEPEVLTSQLVKSVRARLDGRRNAPPRGIRSGFSELDFIIGGLQPGHLCVAAARPRVGKTTFALAWMLHCIRRLQVPALLSFEMSSEQIADRMTILASRLDGQRFAEGALNPKEWEQFNEAEGLMRSWSWFVRDRVSATLQSVAAEARQLRKKEAIDLLIIDYLGLMSGKGENRVADLSEITRGLKMLARELEIPILCLAQLNRAIEARGNDKPRLSDLRESGSIEQDADQVIFITRDLESDADLTEASFIVEKNRHGRSGKVRIEFDKRYGGFVQGNDYAH